MAGGKWLEGLTPERPAADAARSALAARLGAARHHAEHALEGAVPPAEAVRQLRVATRRAAATLRAFAPLIAPRVARRARRVLRDLRRLAGAVRDADVFAESVAQAAPLAGSPALPLLQGYALAERLHAEAVLLERGPRLARKLDRVAARIPDAVRDDEDMPLIDVASQAVAAPFADFAARLGGKLAGDEELHELRIAAKRLRYAMELFADCYAGPFRNELYPAVAELQGHLGAIQDGHVTGEAVRRILARLGERQPGAAEAFGPAVKAYLHELAARRRAARKRFGTWQKAWAKLSGERPLAGLALGATAGDGLPKGSE